MEEMLWLWVEEDLSRNPSILSGILPELEKNYRREGVKVIKKIGQMMNFKPNPTLATACVFFQRFYMFYSFSDYPHHVSALACLFLAGKVEDMPKKCKDLLLKAKEIFPEEFVWLKTDELILVERLLLQTIRFDLHVEHPYNFLVQYAKSFTTLDKECLNKVVTNAWTFVNDSLATEICLLWEPEIVAVAMLFMAFKMRRIELGFEVEEEEKERRKEREEEEEGGHWWDTYVAGLSKETVEGICHKVLDAVDRDDEETEEIP